MILACDKKELTLIKALNMLHDIFPERAFNGNAGPSVIMTDNCDECFEKKFSKFMFVTFDLSYATTSLALAL